MKGEAESRQGKTGSLFIFVGDLSADRHTAVLIRELKNMAPDLEIWGVGGDAMARAGAHILYNCANFACVGIFEVLRQLPFLYRLRQEMIAEIGRRLPDAVLLVDFAGFNLNLARQLKRLYPALPLIYFISPQVWGSRPWRMRTIMGTISKMLVIFPFEEPLYRRQGVAATFVGHPLLKNLPALDARQARQELCLKLSLDPEFPLIAVFPGSRSQEIEDLVPVVRQAVEWMLGQRPDTQFLVSQANAVIARELERMVIPWLESQPQGHKVRLVKPEDGYKAMAASDIVWAKSGTTTLEAALYSKPMVIFYRGNWLSYLLFLIFKQVKNVGWPNLLAGKTVVPELLQLDCRAELLVRYTCDWLDVPGARSEIVRQLAYIRKHLGQGDFPTTAAGELLASLGMESQGQN